MKTLVLKRTRLFFAAVFVLISLQASCIYSQANENLNDIISKINKMEKELQNLQAGTNTFESSDAKSLSSNTIASHEKRLVDLEEEFRILNGRIDEIFFELGNITDKISEIVNNTNNLNENSTDDQNLVAIEEKPNETVTLKDPNMQDNPSMKVLGVINENDDLEKQKSSKMKLYNSEKIEKDKEAINSAKMQNQITDEQIAELSKNPSDIYKHAYKMLIQENFLEAEKFFNIYLGENPNDPLASNAYYWLGETFYVQKQFQKAAISFAKGYQKFPKGNKALDQLFKLALTFINLGKNEDACASFSKLELEFPNASERIKTRAKEYKKRANC